MEKQKRGFASMDIEKQREIASKGGKAAHAKGKARRFTSEEAKIAGKKGGEAVSRNREHMAEIGRKGGRVSSRRKKDETGQGGSVDATDSEALRPTQDSDALLAEVGGTAGSDTQGIDVGSGTN